MKNAKINESMYEAKYDYNVKWNRLATELMRSFKVTNDRAQRTAK
jgi:hypothetical protein